MRYRPSEPDVTPSIAELREALHSLPPAQQDHLLAAADRLAELPGVGSRSSLELLYCLGRFLKTQQPKPLTPLRPRPRPATGVRPVPGNRFAAIEFDERQTAQS